MTVAIVQGQVHDVGWWSLASPSWSLGAGRTVLGPQELVVVQFVTSGPGVALVLGHGVRNTLVNVHIHLGAKHGHVVT